jgi:hypothetical protein
MEWRSDRGPLVSGVRMRNVRAVSIGERRIAERAEETKERIKVVLGDVDVRISAVNGEVSPSSGRPKTADRRLRMKVFKVGSSRE